MSLIDVIVGIALLLTIFVALFGALKASLALSALAKAKAAAVEIANTQMEYLRGLSYDALGTVGGIPAGAIAASASTTVDGVPYGVRTYITYYDDPQDGLGSNDENGVTTDYKVAKVAVSYSINGLAKSVALVSNFAPPGIESSTGGGTLSIHVVDASGTGLADATVHIVNSTVSPAVDFSTFSNASGYAIIGGAATSSDYQIYVSKAGYSSAQTYARTGTNVNPTPGYLTVAKDQTTSATFSIDRLAALTLESFSPATTTTFTDTFSGTGGIAVLAGTQVAGGALTLATDALSGSARSVTLTPTTLDGWGILSADLDTPPGTSAAVHITDGSGTPLPDAVLPGNSAGFSSFPVSLTGIATSSYPMLALSAELMTDSTSSAPSVLDWSLSRTEGPAVFPNLSFSLTGAKTIGTDGSGVTIPKTTVSGSTGSSASTMESLEWDAYALSGSDTLIETCAATPYTLSPGQSQTARLLVGTPTANTLPVTVEDGSGAPVGGAAVTLTRTGYAATVPTSACGLAYFSGLATGTYDAVASAPGYASTSLAGISVAGHAATTSLSFP